MSTKLILIAKIALSMAAAAAVIPANANASVSGTGKVISYELNGGIPHRGACIRLSPAIAGPYASMCVYDYASDGANGIVSNYLYNELNDLFREAFIAGRTCTISASSTGSDLAIYRATCY